MRISKIKIAWSMAELPVAGRRVPGVRYRIAGIAQAATSVALGFLCLSSFYGQETQGQEIQPEKANVEVCPDPPPQTSGSHVFRRAGETIDIPISLADCQPLDLVLRWANGRNNGSNFSVTFLDSQNQPFHFKGVSGFLSGISVIPLTTLDPQPWFAAGSTSIVSVPTTVVIQAGQPFAYPANISYTVTRKAARVPRRPRAASLAEVEPRVLSTPKPVSTRAPILDNQVAMKLRTTEGRLLSQGQGSWASGSTESVRYKLKELTLPEPREMEIDGRRKTVTFAYRLTLAAGELRSSQPVGTAQMAALSKFGMIWLDDAALPAFSLDAEEISTLIYDRSVLKDGAQISVSNSDGSNMYSIVERLKYPSNVQSAQFNVKTNYEPNAQASTPNVQSTREREEGNEVVGIHRGVRVIGATRMPLVQIEFRTSRPFPPRDSALQLQIGKRFFLNELTGDYTGRTLTLTLTQEMFTELKQGAEIVAFFDKPDRSGFAGRDVWHFGQLDKGSRP